MRCALGRARARRSRYAKYCFGPAKDSVAGCRVLERAVRHCPESAELWTELLLAMEGQGLAQAHATVKPTSATHSIWAALKAGETVYQTGELCPRFQDWTAQHQTG